MCGACTTGLGERLVTSQLAQRAVQERLDPQGWPAFLDTLASSNLAYDCSGCGNDDCSGCGNDDCSGGGTVKSNAVENVGYLALERVGDRCAVSWFHSTPSMLVAWGRLDGSPPAICISQRAPGRSHHAEERLVK